MSLLSWLLPNPAKFSKFQPDGYLYTKTINGHQISFTDFGYVHDGPAIITFSGWAQDHRGWSDLTPYLMLHHRVISVCFRGHGPNRDPVEDFGFADHARDVLALLDTLGVDKFICLSASHGSWAAIELAEMVGRERMPALLMLDLNMTPLSPQFTAALAGMQDAQKWRATILALFKSWGSGVPKIPIAAQGLKNMGGFGYETWSRSARTIQEAYGRWGTPFERLKALEDPPLVHHVYSQPDTAEYEILHRDFMNEGGRKEWFSYKRSKGNTHVPHIEMPGKVDKEVKTLVARAGKRAIPVAKATVEKGVESDAEKRSSGSK
ncbi:alpha/beta-hydrolase [Triangularia setosa]|uniref:Alpha/beta-hydrolase n=1 Tax=Triangularia setosa TaxID=2587417 RepID=A0AAN7A3M8_9PEZI|nr:alpha/beta-hydrolase [Podospora setosa]